MNEVAKESRILSNQGCPDGQSPPAETLGLAKSLLSAHHAEWAAKRYRQQIEMARVQERSRSLLLSRVRAEPAERSQLDEEWRSVIAQRIEGLERVRQPGGGPVLPDVETFPRAGITLAVPPYDFDWVSGNRRAVEHADRMTGKYALRVQSLGNGQRTAAAGIGFWFFSGAGNPAQRFSALLDYSHAWFDSASFYVAHNNQHTRLWVFGASEKTWVAQSDVTPSWSDGVGWLDSHGNDPEGEEGRVSNETYFNAAPNSWYQCWIWSEADVYGDSGFWGFAASSTRLNISVPFAVLGSLG